MKMDEKLRCLFLFNARSTAWQNAFRMTIDDNISPILNAKLSHAVWHLSREKCTGILQRDIKYTAIACAIIIMILHTIHDNHVTSRKATVASRLRNLGSLPLLSFFVSFSLFFPIQRAKVAFKKRPFPLSGRTGINQHIL